MSNMEPLQRHSPYPEEKIVIKKSPTADSRTCDSQVVTDGQLFNSTARHIDDIRKVMHHIEKAIILAYNNHDWTKMSYTPEHFQKFYNDFRNKFENSEWVKMHYATERHHLATEEGIRDDVDLIDVIEYLADGLVSGLGRTGKYREANVTGELLLKAFRNTEKKLLDIIEVEE